MVTSGPFSKHLQPPNAQKHLHPPNAQIEEVGRVPIIGYVGADDRAPDFSDLDYQPGAAMDWVPRPTKGNVGPHTYALWVKGDSMTPLLAEGDIIIIDPDRQTRNGDLAVIRDKQDRAYVKAVLFRGEEVALKSYNPDTPEMVKRMDEIQFLSKVIAIVKGE